VKLRLAVDADDEPGARAMPGKSSRLWTSPLRTNCKSPGQPAVDPAGISSQTLTCRQQANVRPDDALTRFRYVIRNLPGATFMSPRANEERTGLYQWLPDKWSMAKNYEQVVHPAIRAAGIYVSADPAH